MISIGDKDDIAFNLRKIIDLAEDCSESSEDNPALIAKLAKRVLESLQEP